jgi:hypothetical protein
LGSTFITYIAPEIVPLAVFAWMTIVAVAGIIGKAHERRVAADERMAMLQRGVPPEQIALMVKPVKDEEVIKTRDPLRSLGNARRAGIVLVSVGSGLVLFGNTLSIILQQREIMVVAATGIIPLLIGLGFFVDYSLQKRELSRFGLEVGAELPSDNGPR